MISDDDFSDEGLLGSGSDDGGDFGIEVGFKDFERCGAGRCHPLLVHDFPQDITDLRKRMMKISIDENVKFAYFLNAYFYTHKDELELNDDDLFEMLDKIYDVPDIKYKNPLAYLLGYACLEKNIINKVRMKKIFALDIDETVKPADIVRYGRLWQNII